MFIGVYGSEIIFAGFAEVGRNDLTIRDQQNRNGNNKRGTSREREIRMGNVTGAIFITRGTILEERWSASRRYPHPDYPRDVS